MAIEASKLEIAGRSVPKEGVEEMAQLLRA
jgi:hypothetical protein